MNMVRRDFVKGVAASAAALAVGGCQSLQGGRAFYGPTIRDRLWMWGHHHEMCHQSTKNGARWPGPTVEQAEGCRLMGIPNDCVIRWGNKPVHPWGDYFEQFRSLKRFTFGITDGGNGTVRDKMKWAFEEIKPNFPNFTGCFLDDYFVSKKFTQKTEELARISDEVHAQGLRLSVVLYSDQDGFKPAFSPQLALCDETSLWFWKSANIGTMADNVRRCRDFIGPDKDLLLGLYMWDYTLGEPVSAERMELQLGYARKFLADRTVTGLIFHPSYSAALDVPSVNLAKKWIAAFADQPWGV